MTATGDTTEKVARKVARAELHADAVIHVLGVGASVAGGVWLIASTAAEGSATLVTGIVIYALTLCAALTFSALYNTISHAGAKDILRRFDHSAIFLLIAGTYSPFMLAGIADPWVATVYAFLLTAAVVGITIKFTMPRRFDRLAILLYLAMGWSGALILGPLSDVMSAHVLTLIGIGGALYSVGVLFHVWEKLPFQNAIWHAFVLAAAICHFGAVTAFAQERLF